MSYGCYYTTSLAAWGHAGVGRFWGFVSMLRVHAYLIVCLCCRDFSGGVFAGLARWFRRGWGVVGSGAAGTVGDGGAGGLAGAARLDESGGGMGGKKAGGNGGGGFGDGGFVACFLGGGFVGAAVAKRV